MPAPTSARDRKRLNAHGAPAPVDWLPSLEERVQRRSPGLCRSCRSDRGGGLPAPAGQPPLEDLLVLGGAVGLRRERGLVDPEVGEGDEAVALVDLGSRGEPHDAEVLDGRRRALDRDGRAVSGFLRLDDIYKLDLNADLVVLSACDTALGREIRGEGLIGMTQAFLFAGARSLIVSLWKVDDAATKELMARFYEGLLADGLRPAQALRQAQLSLAAERRYGHPFFWSGFVLTGDWR